MEAPNRPPDTEIMQRLVEKSASFSFVQAIRLILRELARQQGPDTAAKDRILEQSIRVRPELSLRFPGTDITKIESLDGSGEDPRYRVTATFLGLYGSSSPLPSFYTEDLLDERNDDKSIQRDFLDIINYRLYPLFFRIWAKYRLFYKICEEQDHKTINLLYALLGLENEPLRREIRHHEKLYRYTSLAIQFPHSAEGLENIIKDFFKLESEVHVVQCVFRKVAIPDDQYARLGTSYCMIGDNSVIGSRVTDISGKFQIQIRHADAQTLHEFLPDRQAFKELTQMVTFYVNQPLVWDLSVELTGEEIEPAQPGNSNWANLGWNTWLFSKGRHPQTAKTVLK